MKIIVKTSKTWPIYMGDLRVVLRAHWPEADLRLIGGDPDTKGVSVSVEGVPEADSIHVHRRVMRMVDACTKGD